MPEQDPLESLLLDAAQVDRTRIASALKSVAGIDRKSGDMHPLQGFGALSAKQKIIAYFLTQKVAYLLEIKISESVPNKDFPEVTGLSPGTAAPTLKGLRDTHSVSQTESGEYYLNSPQVLIAVELLEN